MTLITQHPYIKIERKIDGLTQVHIEHSRMLYLYADKDVSAYVEFPINVVTDFSYRPTSGSSGMLYLHTLRGVYPYQVKQSPEAFIAQYRAYFK